VLRGKKLIKYAFVYICITYSGKRRCNWRRKMETTIRLNKVTKKELDNFKQYKNESYNELIRKLIYIVKTCENEPKLSQKAIQEIKEARERIKKGKFYTEAEAKKILGL